MARCASLRMRDGPKCRGTSSGAGGRNGTNVLISGSKRQVPDRLNSRKITVGDRRSRSTEDTEERRQVYPSTIDRVAGDEGSTGAILASGAPTD